MYWLFFLEQQTAAFEPVFTLGNVITIVIVIVSAAIAVVRIEAKAQVLEEGRKQNADSIRELKEIVKEHLENDEQHIGRRLYNELMRRFDEADSHRERIEAKLDRVVSQTK